jgi:hypothetical protein
LHTKSVDNWKSQQRAIACALPNRARVRRVPRNIAMHIAPHLNLPTATAAIDPTKAAATPRIKLSSHGFSIDHPDPELGSWRTHWEPPIAMRCTGSSDNW